MLDSLFAQLQVPGTDEWRSYSYAHAPASGSEIEMRRYHSTSA